MLIKDIFTKYFSEKRDDIIFYNVCEERISFQELKKDVESIADCLSKTEAVHALDYVLLQIGDKKEFLSLLIALFYLEAIPVILPVCTGIAGLEQLQKIQSEHPGILILADEEGEKNLSSLSEGNLIPLNIRKIKPGMELDRGLRAKGMPDESLIMYSSGSTAEPKGTILTAENILSAIKIRNDYYEVSPSDKFMTWMSLEHIVGMIDFLFVPFYNGCSCIYSEISSFLANPKEWFDILEQYQVTITAAPNFAYKYMTDAIEQGEYWDLSSVRIMMNLGEPISRKIITDYLHCVSTFHIEGENLLCIYGLSETTSGVVINKAHCTKKLLESGRIQSKIDFDMEHFDHIKEDLICQGKAVSHTQIRIVNEEGKEIQEYCIGHIELKGDTVCKGYFCASNKKMLQDGWLSTGDIGLMAEGELYVIGRKKDVLFSYGRNIYLRDIEYTVSKYFHLRNVACGENIPGRGESYIYVFAESAEVNSEKLKTEIKHTVLKELGIKIQDVRLTDKLSNTKAGKISKAEILKKYHGHRSEAKKEGSRQNEDAELKTLLTELFNEEIGDETFIYDFADDSLKMFRLIGAVYKKFGIGLGIMELTEIQTVKELWDVIVNHLSRERQTKTTELEKNSSCKTSIQEAYLLGRQQEFFGNRNMSHFYMEVEHTLNLEKAESSIRRLVERHPMLRTIYKESEKVILDEQIAQEFHLETVKHESWEIWAENRKKIQSIVNDPGVWPLFSIKNICIADDVNVLAIDMDMLIADGFSLQILFQDFRKFYQGESLADIKSSFEDYLQELEERKNSDKYIEDKEFWLKRAGNFPQSPKLPILNKENTDPNIFKRTETVFSTEEWTKLEDFAKANDVTVSILLLSLYTRTLKRWCEAPDFAVNVTVIDRPLQLPDINEVAGDFTTNVLFDYCHWDYLGLSFKEELIHNKNKLYTYLDHDYFNGVEVIREIAKKEQNASALMPVVFTSMLFSQKNAVDYDQIRYFITQTSQVYLDCQIYQYENKYAVVWDYLEKIYPENMAEAMFRYYCQLIRHIIDGEGMEYVTIEEEKIIAQYNRTDKEFTEKTLSQMLEEIFIQYKDNIAVTDGEKALSYEAVNAVTKDLKDAYERAGICKKDRVVVLSKKNIASVLSMIALARIGATFIPIPGDYPEERIAYIKRNSNSRYVIDPSHGENLAGPDAREEKQLSECQLDDEAYIIYTSGSTGEPKGVAISHRGVMNTLDDMKEKFQIGEKDCILALSALNFDLSIFDIFGTLYAGAKLALIKDPRDKDEILRMLNQHSVTLWNSVPAIMKLFIEGLNGSDTYAQLKTVLLSGDWIGTDLPDKIRKVFPKAQIISLGGATEASIWSIYYPIGEVRPEWNSIPYGYPMANQTIYILNGEKQICPKGVAGEIHIGGKGVALGYVGDQEKTKQSFVEIPPYGRLYRTGDYGKFSNQGTVIFLGRKDGQVKINGFRIELGEIENVLRRNAGIRDALVITDGRNRLAAYYTGVPTEEEELKQELQRYLPDYMIPYRYLYLEQFPLTGNGKIDRQKLPKVNENSCLGADEMPSDETEEKILQVWQEVLGTNEISISNNFFFLGGDSLAAQKIGQRLTNIFSVKVPFAAVVNEGTVKKLGRYIREKMQSFEGASQNNETLSFNKQNDILNLKSLKTDEGNRIAVNSSLEKEFPATNIQQAYLNGRNDSFELAKYNAHYYFEVEFSYEPIDLERGINLLFQRHEVLRSVFSKNGRQRILDEIPVYQVEVKEAGNEEDFYKKNMEIREQLSHKNYDFRRWPLFTFTLLKNNENGKKLLCASINLLICDGDSLRILLKELTSAIKNKRLPELNYTYREYVKALTSHVDQQEYDSAKEYWMKKIDQFPEYPQLPFTQSIEQCREYRLERKSAVINQEAWRRFKEIAVQHQVSPSTLLGAIYSLVLAKWSNQKELLVNITVFERMGFHPDVEKILGDFTKILPLEVRIKNKNIWTLAADLQEEILNNLENKAFDGTEIIRELSKRKNCIGKALLPAVFTCVLFDAQENWFEQLGKLQYAVTQTPQVFLDNQIIEMNKELHISWDYVRELFEPSVIEAMFQDFILGINFLSEGHDFLLNSQEDNNCLWKKYNGFIELPKQTTLQRIFEKQAEKTPDNIALVFRGQSYTYKDIEEKANQIAKYLCARGICGSNVRVGVLGLRKPETIISIIGILKTGAAYVPIDPKFPEERKEFILSDSGCKFLLTDEIYESGELDSYDYAPIGIQALPEALAYIIYTSGSTGRPKGVMISHKAVCNTIRDLNEKLTLNETDCFIGISSVCFDLSVYDIFGAFSTGASLVLVEEPRDCGEIVSLLGRHKVTIWNSVPVIYSLAAQHILERKPQTDFFLRQILLSGDWIPLDLPQKTRELFPAAEFMSLGGATEASIWSIYYQVNNVYPEWKSIPYGIPLRNQSIYVLDFALETCSVNVPGEIYIGGEGVAEGYCGDEEKTKTSFMEHEKFGRIYKTGDMGVLREEGYIEFLGRIDNQIKIRGYRIELGEIENSLNQVEEIKDSIVSYIAAENGNKQLVAYYISKNAEYVPTERIKEKMGTFLPEYMIPQYYVQMEAFPITANGKLDRKALPSPCIQKVECKREEGELTLMQRKLLSIWKKVFGIESIHIDDDFYSLGGDSIILMRLLDEVSGGDLKAITIEDILMYDTVEKLADYAEECCCDELDSKVG
ncbi:MAG: amino acid adenylation domain-containing protein [Clostridiales bacterium]|nr:amino acid adenylation domain-containing protein [Clostridiales bacterium]